MNMERFKLLLELSLQRNRLGTLHAVAQAYNGDIASCYAPEARGDSNDEPAPLSVRIARAEIPWQWAAGVLSQQFGLMRGKPADLLPLFMTTPKPPAFDYVRQAGALLCNTVGSMNDWPEVLKADAMRRGHMSVDDSVKVNEYKLRKLLGAA